MKKNGYLLIIVKPNNFDKRIVFEIGYDFSPYGQK